MLAADRRPRTSRNLVLVDYLDARPQLAPLLFRRADATADLRDPRSTQCGVRGRADVPVSRYGWIGCRSHALDGMAWNGSRGVFAHHRTGDQICGAFDRARADDVSISRHR